MLKRGLENWLYFFPFTLLTVICCGLFLLINALFVNCFAQKCLLNALNVNVNFPYKPTAGREHFGSLINIQFNCALH